MKNLAQDARFALRQLRRKPGFAAVAVLSLALGIGANAAIFSLFDQILLRSLPVQEPDRLVNLQAPGPKAGSTSCNQAGTCDEIFSYPMFRDLEARQEVFEGVAAHRLFGANLSTGEETVSGEGVLVSGSYFPLLGLRPTLGRLLTPEDDQVVGGHPVAVLSHHFWETRLGSDPGVLDQALSVNGRVFTVVGVGPREFHGTTLGARPAVFLPMTMRSWVEPLWDNFENRRAYWAYLFARLRPGVTMDRAAANLNVLYQGILNEVEVPLQDGMTEAGLASFRTKEVVLEPGFRGQSQVHGESRLPLLLLLGVTGMVLLIACANIANLLLARGAGRNQEMAIRSSLGAGRGRLVSQLLTESLFLAVAGGAAGLLVAWWTLSVIGSILPAEGTEGLALGLQPRMLLFTAVLAAATGLFFGVYPALQATRSNLVSGLKGGASQGGGSRSDARFRSALVTAQIALSLALLVCSGLFIRSLTNVSRVELGLNPQGVATFSLAPVQNGYDPDRSRNLFQRVEEELAALPGVTAVSSSMVPMLAGSSWGNNVSVEGFESGPGVDTNSRYNEVGPGFFRTLGIPILAGREFTEADRVGSPGVTVVNLAFARKFGLDPRETVGKRMATGSTTELDLEIVGLVEDTRYDEVKGDVPPLYFTPARQNETLGFLTFYARTAGGLDPVLQAAPGVVRGLDPNLPVNNLRTLEDQAAERVFMDRMISTLATAFALLATLLAAMGLYGVMAYTVTRRTREIGVRMALGADTTRVRTMVLRQVGGMVLVGGAVGAAGAVALGRWAESLLYGVEGHDPMVLVVGSLTLALVALAAGYVPARQATRVDPMIALRAE